MRYIGTNSDGSVFIIAMLPKACVDADGKRYSLKGVRRRAGKTELYGGSEDGTPITLFIDGEDADVSDLAPDAVPGFTLEYPSFEEETAKYHPTERAKIVSHRRFDKAEQITDRTFRGAWRDNGKLDVDMPTAREIWKDQIRAARAPILEQLDVDYIRADEQGKNTEKQLITLRKQRLRDATKDPRLEAAQTPDELKAVWPLD